MNKVRILISEDHNLIRQGLINIIENEPDYLVVGEAEDGNGMVEKYKELMPDIILSDISMPQMNGIEAAKIIFEFDPSAKIIFLTVFNTDEYIRKIIKLGASGLISKQVIKGELITSVKTVLKGESYFPGKTQKDIDEIKHGFPVKDNSDDFIKIDSLCDRERDLLALIADGLTSEEISVKLSVAKKVVDHERSELMEKLELKSFPQLIKLAVEYSFRKNQGL